MGVESEQVSYFPGCVYDLKQEKSTTTSNTVKFTSLDGQQSYDVEARDKVVNGVQGECVIPSLSPPSFAVSEGINLMTPNQLFALQQILQGPSNSKCIVSPKSKGVMPGRHFVVLGAGKTAMDTIVFLQTEMGVPPTDISWVIPNDVWMLSRENSQGPFGYVKALLDADNNKEKAALTMEKQGAFVRLDSDVLPTRFRFPTVGAEEIKVMRKINHKIRRGRVSSISMINEKEHVFIHCTSPGPFNGKENNYGGLIFPSERELVLELLFAPPVSISMSCLAKLESAYQQGTLDTEFGRTILKNDGASANKVLCDLIQSVGIGSTEDGSESTFLQDMKSTITQAMFIALLDKDPMVGYQWLQSNRLSMMSVPGFKGRFVEDLELIVEKGKHLGAPFDQLEMIQKVSEKLEPLRGK